MTRKDHPTAEIVYENLRKEYPKISLGTVYRNLSLLVELGEAIKFPGLDGQDHFDGNAMPHYHFICNDCHSVIDLSFPNMESLNTDASKDFDGIITGHSAYFYGKCKNCNK
jgi:Fur family peroxide stress response transcriptional regulator